MTCTVGAISVPPAITATARETPNASVALTRPLIDPSVPGPLRTARQIQITVAHWAAPPEVAMLAPSKEERR